MVNPYLPDIMQGVVARVSAAFQAREVDPFEVFFDKGIYSQVTKNVYKNNPDSFPLVWLVMPFSTERKLVGLYGETRATLIIVMPTDPEYTQQNRDDNTIKPRLIPIYEVLMQEVQRERWFMMPPKGPDHTVDLLPYWGGGDVNGADNDNLFKDKVDAIRVKNLDLKIQIQNCNTGAYSVNKNTNYPAKP